LVYVIYLFIFIFREGEDTTRDALSRQNCAPALIPLSLISESLVMLDELRVVLFYTFI